MTDHPAITLPSAMHSSGLPMAIQLVGKHHQDERLLEIAKLVEETIDFQVPVPDYP